MARRLEGLVGWDGKGEKDGHRNYTARWLVDSDDHQDGPRLIMSTAGLPAVGSTWAFGNDNDPWAYCHPDWSASPVNPEDWDGAWIVEQPFSTRPILRCSEFTNPLTEPDRIWGSFSKQQEEKQKDRLGVIKNTAHELIRGPIVEFDTNKPNVTIERNLAVLPLSLFAPLIDAVNDAPLWGLEARMVKLSNASWKRLVYAACAFYYVVTYEFDINYKTFDRKAMNEGTKCLKGWAPGSTSIKLNPLTVDPVTTQPLWMNPQNYEAYKDINGECCRCLLDQYGKPLLKEDEPWELPIEYYDETNLLALGLPSSF